MTQNICAAAQTPDSRADVKQAVKKVIPFYFRCALIILLLLFLVTKVLIFVIIPTGSMEPTVQAGDFAACLRPGSQSQLERGTIIGFWSNQLEKHLCKRIVGLPGDLISFMDGQVYVNGEPLDEPYLPEGTVTKGDLPDDQAYFVPMGHYFVMGDNRENSYDSRYWLFQRFVPFDHVECRQLFSFRVPVLSSLIAQCADTLPPDGDVFRTVAASPLFLALVVSLTFWLAFQIYINIREIRRMESAAEIVESHLVVVAIVEVLCYIGIVLKLFWLIGGIAAG